MNYRHAFHAGNHADILKHAVLLFCLHALKRKPASFAVLDTHAGRGTYDLFGDEAQRSPEWRSGIGRLWDWNDPPSLISRYLDAVRSQNPGGDLRVYPGSPVLVAAELRHGDVMMACELHPEEYAELRRRLSRAPNIQIHARDGWEALTALLPPKQRRGLVLIDPPYETEDELAEAAAHIRKVVRRFSHGMYLWWRPLKSRSAILAADAELAAEGAQQTLRADLWVDEPRPEGKLLGSSMLLINPPFGLEEELRSALPALSQRLSDKGGWWMSTSADPR